MRKMGGIGILVLSAALCLCTASALFAAPAVTAVSPADGASGVPVTASVTATFNEAMDPATITSGSFTLSRFIGVKAIAAAAYHAVALKTDGTVLAWGGNDHGQITVPAGLSGVTAIAAGSFHTVILKDDGTVVAWGENFDGQSTVPAGLSGVTAIAAGVSHTVALRENGTVAAWGENYDGQTSVPAGLTGVAAIAAGGNHTVALKNDGTVVAWGKNDYGQATVPAGLSGVIAIAAGNRRTVALRNDGTVVAWGYNAASVPVGLTGVVAISVGSHTVALKEDGTVVAWGANDYGQATVPAGLTGVMAIDAGLYYTVALKNDGTVVAWGDNRSNQTDTSALSVAISGLVTYDPATFTATYTPAASLDPSTTYTARVNTGVRSQEGSHPASDTQWSFITIGDASDPGYTLPPNPGVDTVVNPASNISIILPDVTAGGDLTAVPLTNLTSPANFMLIGETAFDISFSGTFNGLATICISYDETDLIGNEADIKVLHRVGLDWINITTFTDVVANTICGETTSLSPFTLAEPCLSDSDGDGVCDSDDSCPADPSKIDPGICGCGTPDTDSDVDTYADCMDAFPNDAAEWLDADGDGTGDNADLCDTDPAKTAPGACGCGVADTDSDGDNIADCLDPCPNSNPDDPDGDGICGVADSNIILFEDFEDNILDSRLSIETTGTFNSAPGIKNTTHFGSTKAFGCGSSTCVANCFDGYVTDLKITLPGPTYVSTLSFKEMELYGNWGSGGKIYLDGSAFTLEDEPPPFASGFDTSVLDFGKSPWNDFQVDTTYRQRTFTINRTVSVIELKVGDITSSSEIFIDDLLILTDQSLDADGDGILDDSDNCSNLSNFDQTDSDGDGEGDDCDLDIDNDGIPNIWEVTYGLNPYNPTDAGIDSDGDGLINLYEYTLGTNPEIADTDGDGVADRLDGHPLDNQLDLCADLVRNEVTREIFSTIQTAVDDLNAVNFNTIQVTAADFQEDILCDRNITLTLSGGHSCNFSANIAISSINSLTIKNGTVIVDKLLIKSPQDVSDDGDGDGILDALDNCPDASNPDQADYDVDGLGDICDGCPFDSTKIDPGACGCNMPQIDDDGDGTPDCVDLCAEDPDKIDPGICGCGMADTDRDGDGAVCNDFCPLHSDKVAPGQCGCGVPDIDSDGDGTPDCRDGVGMVRFIDSFDDVGYTQSHWTSMFPDVSAWTTLVISGNSYDGYQGVAAEADRSAATVFDYGTNFYNTNLTVEVLLKVNADSFPNTHDGGGLMLGWDGSNILAGAVNVDSNELNLGNPYTDDYSKITVRTNLSHDTLYRLVLTTDSTIAYLSIYDDFSPDAVPLGTVAYELGSFATSSGMVGIGAEEAATFYDFSVTGMLAPGLGIEICDGIDNDNDVTTADGIDEVWYSETISCGVGSCAGSGVVTCENGLALNTCATGTPLAEICDDGIDQDCDGHDLSCADVDTDGDGMPDGWEIQYDLNPFDASDAALDMDGDGLNNLVECQAGSDPTSHEPGRARFLPAVLDLLLQ